MITETFKDLFNQAWSDYATAATATLIASWQYRHLMVVETFFSRFYI